MAQPSASPTEQEFAQVRVEGMGIFSSHLPQDQFGAIDIFGKEKLSCAELQERHESATNAAWRFDIQSKKRQEYVKKIEGYAKQMAKQRCKKTVGDVADDVLAALGAPRKLWDPREGITTWQTIKPVR